MFNLKPSHSFLVDIRDNQVAGFFALLGLRRCFDWERPSIVQFLFWGIMGAAANTLFSWLQADDLGHFNIQGLVSYLFWPFIALITGIFLSQRISLPLSMFAPAILWLVINTNITLFQSLIEFLRQKGIVSEWLYYYFLVFYIFLFVWQVGIVVWVFSSALKWPWWERVLILCAAVFTAVVWHMAIFKGQPIWKVEESKIMLPETALYEQPRLLNKAFNQLQASDALQPHWYFLGVGGAGYQNVFRSEVDRVKQLFDVQWGTLGRSIGLINSIETFNTRPMATRTSIKESLDLMGKRMNPEVDVLFLYMTSHGNPKLFELSNDPIQMESIDPKWLRKTLDEAGIRWRVIVISACYSGSFIPELQSPDTLIITASAADKESFGCNNDVDYTYFGRAFFDESMRQYTSLQQAYQHTKKLVSQWETAQGFEESRPQWWIGQNIEALLPRFERLLFNPMLAVDSVPTEQKK